MRRAWKAFRVWWYFRRLRSAWRVIRRTDKLMADKPSWKRQAFWREFIYHHDFRRFASQQFNRELFK